MTYKLYSVLLYPPVGTPRIVELPIDFETDAEYKRATTKRGLASLANLAGVQLFKTANEAYSALENVLTADPELRRWKNGHVQELSVS